MNKFTFSPNLGTIILLKNWLLENNLLEAEHTEKDFLKSVAWFKRHLDNVPIYTPKTKTPFVDKKQADAAYLAFSGTLQKTNQNKQKAALKLDARNTGIRIAVRAKALPPDHTTQMRQLFWESEKGKELYSYVLMFKYSKKQHLAPFGLKFKIPSLSSEFIAVLTDEETINLSDIGVFFDSDAQEPAKKKGPGRPKKVQDQHKQDSEAAKEYFKESPKDTLQDESSDQVSLSDNLQEGGNT